MAGTDLDLTKQYKSRIDAFGREGYDGEARGLFRLASSSARHEQLGLALQRPATSRQTFCAQRPAHVACAPRRHRDHGIKCAFDPDRRFHEPLVVAPLAEPGGAASRPSDQ